LLIPTPNCCKRGRPFCIMVYSFHRLKKKRAPQTPKDPRNIWVRTRRVSLWKEDVSEDLRGFWGSLWQGRYFSSPLPTWSEVSCGASGLRPMERPFMRALEKSTRPERPLSWWAIPSQRVAGNSGVSETTGNENESSRRSPGANLLLSSMWVISLPVEVRRNIGRNSINFTKGSVRGRFLISQSWGITNSTGRMRRPSHSSLPVFRILREEGGTALPGMGWVSSSSTLIFPNWTPWRGIGSRAGIEGNWKGLRTIRRSTSSSHSAMSPRLQTVASLDPTKNRKRTLPNPSYDSERPFFFSVATAIAMNDSRGEGNLLS